MKFTELSLVTKKYDVVSDFYKRFFGVDPIDENKNISKYLFGDLEFYIHKDHGPNQDDIPFEDHLGFDIKDLDQACAEIVSRGLTLVAGPEDYYWGRSAYLVDPDNRLLELQEASLEPNNSTPKQFGKKFTELSLVTKKYDVVLDFYKRFFGVDPIDENKNISKYLFGDLEFYIHKDHGPNLSKIPFEDHLGFDVKDLDQACAEIVSRGLTLVAEPEEHYWGRSAYLVDPDNRLLELQ